MSNTYNPLLDKTFEAIVSRFISTEFPRLGGPKVFYRRISENVLWQGCYAKRINNPELWRIAIYHLFYLTPSQAFKRISQNMNARIMWCSHEGELCMIRAEAHCRSTLHKQVICRKSVPDRKATPDIALETNHSPMAVDRYLGDFERVRFCLKKGLSMKEAAFTTQMSKSLLMEYAELIEELNGGGRKKMLIKIGNIGVIS